MAEAKEHTLATDDAVLQNFCRATLRLIQRAGERPDFDELW